MVEPLVGKAVKVQEKQTCPHGIIIQTRHVDEKPRDKDKVGRRDEDVWL